MILRQIYQKLLYLPQCICIYVVILHHYTVVTGLWTVCLSTRSKHSCGLFRKCGRSVASWRKDQFLRTVQIITNLTTAAYVVTTFDAWLYAHMYSLYNCTCQVSECKCMNPIITGKMIAHLYDAFITNTRNTNTKSNLLVQCAGVWFGSALARPRFRISDLRNLLSSSAFEGGWCELPCLKYWSEANGRKYIFDSRPRKP